MAQRRRIRGDERWAADCIRLAIPGIDVCHHDDGTQPGMHDLDLVRGAERFGAVDITAVVDREATELSKLLNRSGQRWIAPGLAGGWAVTLTSAAQAKSLWLALPPSWPNSRSEASRI